MADPHFRDTFSDGDIRLELFQWMREGYLGYKKFHMRADDTADIVLMRASEMLLVEAEALARDGFPEKAVVPLNELRHARGLGDYDLTGKSQQDVIDEILMERRRELWGEGFGITDILRTQQSVKRTVLSAEEQKQEVDAWQEGGGFAKGIRWDIGLLLSPRERYLSRTVPIICMLSRKRRRMRIRIYDKSCFVDTLSTLTFC